MAAVSALRASVGIAVSSGCEMASSAVVTMAALVTTGADGITGGMVAVAVGMAAVVEAPEPDMVDTMLLELELLCRRYEWEVTGRGLNAQRRTGSAVLRAEAKARTRRLE
jgi:hypothetical protein